MCVSYMYIIYMCVCVGMYAYIYMYMYIYMYIYTYKIHTHTHKHTHTGLGFCIAGGLQKLETLTVAARNEAVRAARSAAAKAGNAACELAAKMLGILDAAGNGDVLAFCAAGGLAKLEHLPLQKRIEAAEEARRKISAAGNSKRQIEQQVCDLTAYLIQTMDF